MTANNKNMHLQKLGGSHYEIVKSQSDIRGWDVRDANGNKLGEVDELLVDIQAQKVRYIVLAIEDNDWGLKERNVLIPIGLVELHERDDEVIVSNVSPEQLKALPEYDENKLDTNVERSIRNILSNTGANITGSTFFNATGSDTDFYAHEHFDDNLQRNQETASPDEQIRMRQEPSFLEREGTIHMNIDDDVDTMREAQIELEDRDAIPVTYSNDLRTGNDIDEWDITDENSSPQDNTDKKKNERTDDEQRDLPPRP